MASKISFTSSSLAPCIFSIFKFLSQPEPSEIGALRLASLMKEARGQALGEAPQQGLLLRQESSALNLQLLSESQAMNLGHLGHAPAPASTCEA